MFHLTIDSDDPTEVRKVLEAFGTDHGPHSLKTITPGAGKGSLLLPIATPSSDAEDKKFEYEYRFSK